MNKKEFMALPTIPAEKVRASVPSAFFDVTDDYLVAVRTDTGQIVGSVRATGKGSRYPVNLFLMNFLRDGYTIYRAI
jgi:hypothetical protein